MRLWHEVLLPYISKQRLLGQHRECCAMRGKGWGRPHSTVDYVWSHPYACLFRYHLIVCQLLIHEHSVNVDTDWLDPRYRGTILRYASPLSVLPWDQHAYVYPEHNTNYLLECCRLLRERGEPAFQDPKGDHPCPMK